MTEAIVYVVTSPMRWMRRLYDWTKHWSKTKHAPLALFIIAFFESSFFPVPPDVLLIAMVIYDRTKWIRNAVICTLGSVCGAFLGYFIGWALFESVGRAIVQMYHLEAAVELVSHKYAENAFLTIFTAAFTPIPYKAISITAGLFKISLFILIFASIIGRAGRFFLVAGALHVFGKKIEESIERYFDLFSIAFVILLIGGFLFIKYVIK